MQALPFLLVALLALCLMPSAFSLECYVCTNSPGASGEPACGSDKVTTITCPMYYDRCMTIKYDVSIMDTTLSLEMRNCSISMSCDPQSDLNTCKMMKGMASNCTLSCCQGNLCNKDGDAIPTVMPSATIMGPTAGKSSTVKPSQERSTIMGPTSAVLGLVASFGAILSALVLTLFAGFN